MAGVALRLLASRYLAIIAKIEDAEARGLTLAQVCEAEAQRVTVHWDLMRALRRAGYTIDERGDALRLARQVARGTED